MNRPSPNNTDFFPQLPLKSCVRPGVILDHTCLTLCVNRMLQFLAWLKYLSAIIFVVVVISIFCCYSQVAMLHMHRCVNLCVLEIISL